MLKEKIRARLLKLISQNRELILNTANYIWKNPETGFREWKTSGYMAKQFKALGYKPVLMKGIPGFYADLDTGRPGPLLAVLGELDSIICASHPEADPETGAVHACGHHTQCAYLLGAAAVLKDSEILASLSGKIRFIAVPAEELIELEFRSTLREQGLIKYIGGKVEFLHRGVFDNASAAIMLHSGGSSEKPITIYNGNNGCLTKNITYSGKAAHAGGAPHRGTNALYAAALGINAINAIRETFKEDNFTRVHPIMTEGGTAVNVIPDLAKLESFVRGASPEAIVEENKKVNRALAGAALSMGAGLRIMDIPGYMPLHNNPDLNKLARKAGDAIFGKSKVKFLKEWKAGSTDMGDLSCVMPVLHPSGGGGKGTAHGNDYSIANMETACIDSTHFITAMVCNLLGAGAESLKKIKESHKPIFKNYRAYFDFIDALYSDRELISYDVNEDGSRQDKASVIW